tara:strand:+ start:103943 stop:104977 length:1035 start_codon:yes stop_codon:yes gene_type:complete
MKILGIESSCDETAAAILNVSLKQQSCIISNVVYSQTEEHIEYGGVVPEIASRAHMERIDEIVKIALKDANMSLKDLDAISVTQGPGLLGGLLVGTSFAKSLHLISGVPLIGVNHLEGHALTAHLTEELNFPYLLLLVSGGHCQFIHVKDLADYNTLGATIDDSIGECFDKVAKMLGLSYPGGPNIERLSVHGNPKAYDLPISLRDGSVNFSFSGLKSAVRRKIQLIEEENPLSEQDISDLCASFQETVALTLEYKTKKAMELCGCADFVLAGGVAANKLLRSRLNSLCNEKGVTFHAPPINLCTDNAVMIAYAGGLRLLSGSKPTQLENFKAVPRWPLDKLSL